MTKLNLNRKPQESLGSKITAKLGELGLGLPAKPSGQVPDLPADMTTLTSRDVGKLLSEYCSWLAYITPRVALAKMEAKAAKAAIAQAKAAGTNGEDVSQLEGEFLYKDSFASVLEGLEKATLRKKEATSREISRLIDTGTGREPRY